MDDSVKHKQHKQLNNEMLSLNQQQYDCITK